MTSFGFFLSSEEFTPHQLIEQAQLAEQAGLTSLAISDHFHPWTDEQGSSPFVWSAIGAISQVTSLPVTTLVTCPTVRLNPAVTAQAAATSSVLTRGRFALGVGTGEALNENIFGGPWPEYEVRAEMLEEAVEVMRQLFTGERTSHRGRHYTVQDARLYTVPDGPAPIHVSGFGPKSAALAARIGDGFVTMQPGSDLVATFREAGGGDKQVLGGLKVCWSADRDWAVKTAHRAAARRTGPDPARPAPLRAGRGAGHRAAGRGRLHLWRRRGRARGGGEGEGVCGRRIRPGLRGPDRPAVPRVL